MILTCGEAVIDMLPAELADGASGFRPVTGGAAVNCAIALSRLDQSVGFFGGMSNDAFGQFLMQEMDREGVDLSRISPVAQPSTLAFVHPAGESQGFSFFDTESAGRSLAVTMLPDLTGVQALVFGGISLIHRPALLLADEPTGNLDRRTTAEITALLLDIQQQEHTMLVVVTHNDHVANTMDRQFELESGVLNEIKRDSSRC